MATAQPQPAGLLLNARFVASPNHNARPAGAEVTLLVIHNISLPPGQFGTGCVEQFFCNRLDWQAHPYFLGIEGMEVSAHLLIERSGALIQFVPLHQRAWHAGRSCFEGQENCNDYSIGIELEGTDDQPYSDAQYESLVQVTLQLQQRFAQLANERIVGHSDIAPGRKTDPGPAFDWARFRTQLLDAQLRQGARR
ncbi:1,6-anhydro-N-acetylmuramyl-L-alanine amidase AmpD [Marinobacterium sedimentorum]|uniref:1,6-anhydro-N-acetylmuramyl-L-alanine amidase AmpD n=1 Tax=Marinobacterium sedimentorum TaxID=2927804 RepID=UPI0020C6004A|nr:1,6-anhydro-N-acetylmuramyl-L-alanine amidase AmpD [Marinobacterium sedimentorum]MCP8689559.1 1,6-anhydro-N-acetylmuramyl-L-alanine amidase AmpD [Marinobacterium sedimentorum]